MVGAVGNRRTRLARTSPCADSVPGANLITHHVPYDETVQPDEAEDDELDLAAMFPGGGCLALGHAPFQEAMLNNAAAEGATALRGVRSVEASIGQAPHVTFEHDGRTINANCRLVIGADGRHSHVRKQLGLELESTSPKFMMAGMLIDATHDWSSSRQSTGVEGDFHFLIFPQSDSRVRVYGAWDINDPHRFSGEGREQRFLESFRLSCLPEPGAIADGTPAGPLAGYPMTDTWTDVVAADGAVLIGDAAGWSDPVIGQGMSVTFRDVHMVSKVMTSGSDWSAASFEPYATERKERMRRLRFSSAGSYMRHGFGPEGAAKRRRLSAVFRDNPIANTAATALLGAWVLPESAYTDEAWNALVAV